MESVAAVVPSARIVVVAVVAVQSVHAVIVPSARIAAVVAVVAPSVHIAEPSVELRQAEPFAVSYILVVVAASVFRSVAHRSVREVDDRVSASVELA